MANIGNTHYFMKLEKNSKASSGQRLARVIAKKDRAGNYPAHLNESVCVSLPQLTFEMIAEHVAELAPYIVGLCTDAQDKILRNLIIENGAQSVTDDDIGIPAVLAYLKENATSERVTREYLCAWFDSEFSETCKTWVSERIAGTLGNGSDDVDPILIQQKTNVIRELFAGWSSGKYSPAIPHLKAMASFVEYCADHDAVDDRMISIGVRVSTMLEKKQQELASDPLGFGV